jgi:hypothetical protein
VAKGIISATAAAAALVSFAGERSCCSAALLGCTEVERIGVTASGAALPAGSKSKSQSIFENAYICRGVVVAVFSLCQSAQEA